MCTPRTAAISSAFRPSSVSRIARARSASPRCSDFDRARKATCSAASAVSVDFPGMLGLHSSHPRQTIFSIAHSQAVCLGHLPDRRDRGLAADNRQCSHAEAAVGNGSAEKIVVKYPSERGYSPGDTWELYIDPDSRIQEFVF